MISIVSKKHPISWATPIGETKINGIETILYKIVDNYNNTYYYYREPNRLFKTYHRENGPAIIYEGGVEEYWLYGKMLSSQKEYAHFMKLKAFW